MSWRRSGSIVFVHQRPLLRVSGACTCVSVCTLVVVFVLVCKQAHTTRACICVNLPARLFVCVRSRICGCGCVCVCVNDACACMCLFVCNFHVHV